jgi:purine nucleoside phosphorylase
MTRVIGLIGGSALLKSNLRELDNLKSEVVDTAEGRVFLRSGLVAADTKVVFVQRHDARPDRQYTQPADVNYAAIALALQQKGVNFVIAICSVGSLKASLNVGSVCVPDDFYCPWDLRRIYRDARAHVMPVISEGEPCSLVSLPRLHPP